ncbi:MAG: Na-translocating system protein MpsB [Deltaproteobacteria bacterium]|nr:Na-translocating system protein MpsB [Deltaproteobacteria bacterium]
MHDSLVSPSAVAPAPRTADGGGTSPVVVDPVDRALATLHGLLPDQGPIGVFIHHNTLHALQHLPFERAVVEAASLFGARAWPDITILRAAWKRGRIEDVDVDAVLAGLPGSGDALPLGLDRGRLRRALLREDIDVDDAAGVAFVWRSDPLFVRALALAPAPQPVPLVAPVRHREALLALGADDVDELVHPELVRLGLSFLDLGQARVRMPGRERGFLIAAANVLSRSAPRGGVRGDAVRVLADGLSARAVVDEALLALGVDHERAHAWLVAAGLALRGVAGMFSRLERHPDEADGPTSLLEFMAVRLLIERRAIEQCAQRASLSTSFLELVARAPQERTPDRACAGHLLAGLARAADHNLDNVSADDVDVLLRECAAFSRLERNRLLYLAWERAYGRRVLSGLVALQKRQPTTTTPTRSRPSAQVVFCIDEREESMHRALEEHAPDIETFGAAGFFGMAIDYMGVDDHEPAAHCPVVVTPAHEVRESPVFTSRQWQRVRSQLRTWWHAIERGVAETTRSLVGGAGASVLFGPFAGALAAARVVAPRASLRAWQRVRSSLAPSPNTRLISLRAHADHVVPNSVVVEGKPRGFSLDEAADRVVGLLKSIGLTSFSRVVVLLGHGSTSLNNPHESAHDCGACGGRRGGANARLFAGLANRVDVRTAVAARGVIIPGDTWFIGGLHDTANDGVDLFDLGDVPHTHDSDVEAVQAALEVARTDNARERCRRFLDTPLDTGPAAALAHVEARASHLAQPRPEYGHCTNAAAIVGRRALTRGLHLDRRAFLVSYDPTIDDAKGSIVERVLAAVGPVGAGISLEYWFSAVDNEVYGCGTKLPHNVTGLLGVMNGHQSDLRTGLPLQMVELHEPLRLLLIVEAAPETLLGVAGRQAEVRELVVNGWVRLVSVHPVTGAVAVFEDGTFVPFVADDDVVPVVERSPDWHGGQRDFVDPAIVTAALARSEAA